MKNYGLITSIQSMSIHDGPGIRTTIFLKGCNMRCKWCHNPETWYSKLQMQYIASKCIHCLNCCLICPVSAIKVLSDSCLELDYSKCNVCRMCVDHCPSGALLSVGRQVTAEGLFDEIKDDLPFWIKSNGGITLSGGEPFLQPDFVKRVLSICREKNISTAIETNLLHDWKVIQEFIPLVDYWFCDFKIANSEKHKYWTGVENYKIIENIHSLSKVVSYIKVRTPIIPGVNDTEEDISAICKELVACSGNVRYELLGFHTLGFEKYKQLNMKNELEGIKYLEKQKLEDLKKIPLHFNLLS